MTRFLFFLVSCLSAVAQPGIRAVYYIARQPAGIYRESTTQRAEGGTVTSVESDLIFNRLGSRLEMKSTNQYIETGDGQLTTLSSDTSSSQQSTNLSVRVNAGWLQVSTTTGGKTYQRTLPFTGTLLGPAAARRLTMSRLHTAGDRTSYQTFSPELGTVVTIDSTLLANEDVTIDRRPISSLKLEQTVSSMPGKATVWVDHDGWMVRQLVPTPFGDLEAIRTESAESSVASMSGASLPEETFSRSIIKANVRLPQERLVESIKLRITHRRPQLGWPELDADNQQVLEKTPDYVVLKVTRTEPKEHEARAIEDSAGLAPYLAPNALLQSDDSNITNIASSVIGKERDPWPAARALQRWTNENMRFDAGIAIAPASEVARNRRGTCFGYSMLLGSLTRAAGIASRVRMGYVYAGGIWGGHAWIDVRIGGRWIPLDGALYSPGAADAARFSFFTSALEEGTLAQVGSLGQMFGNVDIRILEYTVGGRTVAVPDDAKPFTISNNTYHDPWLGFSVVKPASFQFSGVGLAWPQTTVVAMDGPRGQRLEIENRSASLPTATGPTGLRNSKVLIRGGNVWVFTATGPKAGKLLEQVVSTVVFE